MSTSYDTHRRLQPTTESTSTPAAAPSFAAPPGGHLHTNAEIAALILDAPGFHGESGDWTPERAETLAAWAGLAELTDHHWQVIALCREETARCGAAPDTETLARLSGLTHEHLTSLFPDDPAALVAEIAGVANRNSR